MKPDIKPEKRSTFMEWMCKQIVDIQSLLYKQIVILLLLFVFASCAGALLNSIYLTNQSIEDQALQGVTVYAKTVQTARTLYASNVVDRLANTIEATHDYRNKPNTIPLPVTFLIDFSHAIQYDESGIKFRLYSDYPFPSRAATGGARTAFEKEAIAALSKNSQQPFYKFTTENGQRILHFASADIMQPSCVACHNQHPDSPKRDWKVGDVRGVLSVTSSLDRYIQKSNQGLFITFLGFGGLLFLGGGCIALVISHLRNLSQELEARVRDRTAQLRQANYQLAEERSTVERLLLNVLPESISQRLRSRPNRRIVDNFADVAILFADIANFTPLSDRISPRQLVELLDEIFSIFDELAERHGLEKIKTIGDAYMVVGGVPEPQTDSTIAIANMALDMVAAIEREREHLQSKLNLPPNWPLSLRIGIASGEVVAGIVGKKKFAYDLWGDAVNVASRMESHGLPNRIQVTAAVRDRLQSHFLFEARGRIQIKGKGEMETYWLVGRIPQMHPIAPVPQ